MANLDDLLTTLEAPLPTDKAQLDALQAHEVELKLALGRWFLEHGQRDQARQHFDTALTTCRTFKNLYRLMNTIQFIVESYLKMGQMQPALPFLEELNELAAQHQLTHYQDTMANTRVTIYGRTNRLPEAIALLECSIERRAARLGDFNHSTLIDDRTLLAELYKQLDREQPFFQRITKRLAKLFVFIFLFTFSAQIPAPIQVFLLRDGGTDGRDQLIFLDIVSNTETSVDIDGDRYTLLPDAVLFNDRTTNRPMLAYPDGHTAPHPFIAPRTTTRRIDWILSPDRTRIAWTLTDGTSSALSTTTEIANLDGTDRRVIFVDAPREGIRAFPVALLADRLVMDYQPDTLGDLTPFRQYAGLFAVNLMTGTTSNLPNEPGCFCGAAVTSRLFARMALAADRPGYEMRVFNMESGVQRAIPPPGLDTFTQGGDVLIAPDGNSLVYALAQVRGFGTTSQSVQTVFMWVDLVTGTQRALSEPINALLRPTAWTPDGRALLFTNPTGNGTWRLDIETTGSSLELIADAVYLGSLYLGTLSR